MKNLIKSFITSFFTASLVLSLVVFINQQSNKVLIEKEFINQALAELEPLEPEESHMFGIADGEGIYFEIKESEYLNVVLKSTQEIKARIESIPKLISLNIEASNDDIIPAILTIENLKPDTTYYKYQNSYKDKTVFVSDENGSYVWTQEINEPHHIWFQEEKSTVFLPEDCSAYGAWDEATLTCALNQNLTQSIEITQDNIALDCNGYNIISSTGSGYGLYLNSRSGVNITNCSVDNFSQGIYFYYSDNNNFIGSIALNNYAGIYLAASDNNAITNNDASGNSHGIYLVSSANNTIADNNISNNEYGIHFINYTDPSNSDSNVITGNNISNNSESGIRFQYSHNNIAIGNTLSNNKRGIFVYSASGNKIYHNNFIDNFYQASANVFKIFDNGYPTGGNYWSGYIGIDEKSGINQDQDGSDGIGDTPYTFTDGQDRYPFIAKNGWETMPPPPDLSLSISNLAQFKSDSATQIIEESTTTENSVIFKAIPSDMEGSQVKIQVELRQKEELFSGMDDGGILNSDLIDSGSEAMITKNDLADGEYHWRARTMDAEENFSEWLEFGDTGNADFTVKTVPLYTQVESPYPLRTEEEEWANEDYAEGLDYDCGSTIADCGCAITSMVMLGRFYDIDIGIDSSNADPGNINDWLNDNRGYSAGNLYWSKAVEYLGFIDEETDKKMARFSFDYYNEPFSSSRIGDYIDNIKPIVAYSAIFGHYFVVDGRSIDTYTVKDPYWYNTETLNDSRDTANHIQDYNSYFARANLFSYLETPKKIAALMSIYLASPAELIITDPEGKRIGRDPINNIIYNEIPGGSYTLEGAIISSDDPLDEIHEKKVVYIPNPNDGLYNIQVIGTGDGDYTLTFFIYDDEGRSREVIQEGSIIQNNIQKFELNYSTQDVQQVENYQLVDIDIKPGSESNSINIESNGVISVAVLSNQFFDAQKIVIKNILFAGAQPLKGKIEDADNDGDLDLILHFETQSLNLTSLDTEAILTGKLNDGTLIKGSDPVRIIDKNNKK